VSYGSNWPDSQFRAIARGFFVDREGLSHVTRMSQRQHLVCTYELDTIYSSQEMETGNTYSIRGSDSESGPRDAYRVAEETGRTALDALRLWHEAIHRIAKSLGGSFSEGRNRDV
jgi:hypothetical protein